MRNYYSDEHLQFLQHIHSNFTILKHIYDSTPLLKSLQKTLDYLCKEEILNSLASIASSLVN